MNLGQNPINSFSVQPGIALDETGDRQYHGKSDHSDGDLAWKIATGRDEMPSWIEDFSESEIWDLVNYIKTFGIDAAKNR